MRVIHRGDRAGLALKSLAKVVALGDVFGQDFDGDGAVKPGVAGFVDLAHPSRAKRGDDFVGTEFVDGGKWHGD